jgi:YVTN family beta-propeller protein
VGYELGVDLGATTVAAAVTADSRVQMVDLGAAAATVPAVVFLEDDGSLIAGEAAARRAAEHPARAGRELTRKLGRPAPVRLGDTPYPPGTLLGALLQHVVARVAETAGGQPDRVLLTHPAHWPPARLAAFTEAARGAGLPEVRTATTAEAVVTHYATTGRIAEGDTVAVFDLGGDSFSAEVLRRTPNGVEPLGQPEGIERLGGGTFDEALLSHVNQATGGPLAGLDRRDPEHAAAVAGLRRNCATAKQELSTEGATTIRVLLPNRQADVAVTRPEFEQLIRTSIETTIGALLKALQSAGVEPRELAAVLLVGGSSQIPLVAKMVSEVLARPIMLDPDPKRPVTMGAATLAAAVPDTAAPSAPPATEEARVPTGPAELPTPPAPAAVTDRVQWSGAWKEPAAVPVPRDRREVAARAAGVGTRERSAAGAPASLFEPSEPFDPTGSMSPPEPAPTWEPVAVTAAAATTAFAPPAPAPDRSPPSFLAGDTTVIPSPDRAAPAGFVPAGPTADGFTPDRSTPPDTDRIPPSGPPEPSWPPPPPAPRAGRRRRPVVLAALALVVVLAGIGYAVWTLVPSAAPVAAPPAPGAEPADRPAPASVPIPAVGATVPVGDTPGFVVVSPDGRHALVANQAAGVVTVVDTATNTVAARVPVPTGPPQYLAYSPDGRRVYVSIWDQARTVAAVGVLDTATNQFLATIPVRTRPYLSAVTPDGQRLYVPNHDSGTISVIDTGTNTVTSEIKVAPNPHWVEMSADGSRAYAANHESNVVSVIDTTDNSILAEVPVQTSPHSLAVHPNRPLVANVNYDSASVTMIDTNTDKVVATVAVGKNPQDISWAPDGRHGYVANTSDGTVSVIDTDTETVTATIPTGKSPTSIAVLPDGSAAYVSNLGDGTLSVLKIAG